MVMVYAFKHSQNHILVSAYRKRRRLTEIHFVVLGLEGVVVQRETSNSSRVHDGRVFLVRQNGKLLSNIQPSESKFAPPLNIHSRPCFRV